MCQPFPAAIHQHSPEVHPDTWAVLLLVMNINAADPSVHAVCGRQEFIDLEQRLRPCLVICSSISQRFFLHGNHS